MEGTRDLEEEGEQGIHVDRRRFHIILVSPNSRLESNKEQEDEGLQVQAYFGVIKGCDLRTTSQKCALLPRRARIGGS